MGELCDLETAPFELDNLLPDRAPPGLVEELEARLTAQLSRSARS